MSFGNLEFETEEGGKFHIKYNNSNNKKVYNLKKGNKKIAKVICAPMKFVDDYSIKYIIEYDSKEYQKEIVLLATMHSILV